MTVVPLCSTLVFVPLCCSLFKIEGQKDVCMLPHLVLIITFWNGDYYLYLTHEETRGYGNRVPKTLD